MQPAQFQRAVEAEQIVSACKLCGFKLIQLVFDGKDRLEALEWEHAKSCKGSNGTHPSSQPSSSA